LTDKESYVRAKRPNTLDAPLPNEKIRI